MFYVPSLGKSKDKSVWELKVFKEQELKQIIKKI